MSDKKKQKHYLRIPGLILLALLCIGGTELAVCRIMDPDLFQEIMQPAARLKQSLQDQGKNLLNQIRPPSQPPQTQQEEAAPVSQEIQEPETASPLATQDPTITQFRSHQDQEVLTGGVVELIYFNQGESPWAEASFGPDSVKGFGCGPTAMSMVVSTLGPELVDPAQMAQTAYELGYCAPGSGSYLSIVEGLAQHFGLEAHSCGELSADDLYQRLATGQLLIALMGPGHFTSGGHFIVLRGATLTGQILVADPNSRERSLALWDPQLILDELSSSRSSGAPLWYFPSLGS